MVLVVVPDVECDCVQRAVVGVGLEALVEHVVLGDEVARHGVEAHGHQGTARHVEQHLTACTEEEKTIHQFPTICMKNKKKDLIVNGFVFTIFNLTFRQEAIFLFFL